jgi:hypothetical protein
VPLDLVSHVPRMLPVDANDDKLAAETHVTCLYDGGYMEVAWIAVRGSDRSSPAYFGRHIGCFRCRLPHGLVTIPSCWSDFISRRDLKSVLSALHWCS